MFSAIRKNHTTTIRGCQVELFDPRGRRPYIAVRKGGSYVNVEVAFLRQIPAEMRLLTEFTTKIDSFIPTVGEQRDLRDWVRRYIQLS